MGFVGVNQEYSLVLLAAGGNGSGHLNVLNADPLAHKLRLQQCIQGKLVCASVLGRSNWIAIVDSLQPTTVQLWDDWSQTVRIRVVESSRVLAVHLFANVGSMAVVLLGKIRVYLHAKFLCEFPTASNDDAVCSIATKGNSTLLAFMGTTEGHLHYCSIHHSTHTKPPAEKEKQPILSILPAHSSRLRCVAVSSDTKYIATTSIAGTLIRVFDAASRTLVHEFRRGTETAVIYSLHFSLDARMLLVGSDRGTVHVFLLANPYGGDPSDPGVKMDRRTGTNPMTFHEPNARSISNRIWKPSSLLVGDPQNGGFPTRTDAYDFSHGANSAPASMTGSPSLRALGPPPSHITRSSGSSNANSAGAGGNRGSSLGFLAPLNKYFKSQWSFAQCSVAPGVPFVCFFGHLGSDPSLDLLKADVVQAKKEFEKGQVAGAEDAMRWSPAVALPQTSVVVVSQDGSYYKFALDLRKGSECVLERFYRIKDEDSVVYGIPGGDRVGEVACAGMAFGMAVR